MIQPNPNCVYVTNSKGQADIVAVWLLQRNVDARVNSNTSLGGLPELILWSNTKTASGAFEVWVPEDYVHTAKLLVTEWQTNQQQFRSERQQKGPVTTNCESCSRSVTLPAEKRGRIVVCVNCSHYIDVPE